MKSVQEIHAPASTCYGCGPANEKGFRIRSFPVGDELHCEWMPEPHHEAFSGCLNGGVVGTLLDCHCNWTAACHLMEQNQLEQIPCTVTASYEIKLKRPTPMADGVKLTARVVESEGNRAVVEGELHAGGKVCATCRGVFVAVTEGHPAFHRWV